MGRGDGFTCLLWNTRRSCRAQTPFLLDRACTTVSTLQDPTLPVQASSATRAGGEKDARLQYLSWRIWFMQRRHALVKEQQRGAEEEAVMTPTSYSEVRLGAGQREGGVWTVQKGMCILYKTQNVSGVYSRIFFPPPTWGC